MSERIAKIIRLKIEEPTNSRIRENEVNILRLFHQELLKIDDLIPDNIKSESERNPRFSVNK